jgi:hypothetical protein
VKASSEKSTAVVVQPEKMSPEERSVYDVGVEGFRSCQIIPRMNELLDQKKHHRPPSINEWTFCGPAKDLMALLLERNSGIPDGLPLDADSLVAWLRVPANAKRVRASQILISFIPHPRNGKEVIVRLERAASVDEYHVRGV